ncbi:hypothetical protein B0J17DRAFT_630033 [Rhizoctonia solani]|nr:hypothetical protein B0J17DRAFT_630033 [Rhizoctonia solani]
MEWLRNVEREVGMIVGRLGETTIGKNCEMDRIVTIQDRSIDFRQFWGISSVWGLLGKTPGVKLYWGSAASAGSNTRWGSCRRIVAERPIQFTRVRCRTVHWSGIPTEGVRSGIPPAYGSWSENPPVVRPEWMCGVFGVEPVAGLIGVELSFVYMHIQTYAEMSWSWFVRAA